jgi:hypothetical protein
MWEFVCLCCEYRGRLSVHPTDFSPQASPNKCGSALLSPAQLETNLAEAAWVCVGSGRHHFRVTALYTEAVDVVFEMHMPLLLAVYDRERTQELPPEPALGHFVPVDGFVKFIQRLKLLTDSCTAEDVRRCAVWSVPSTAAFDSTAGAALSVASFLEVPPAHRRDSGRRLRRRLG